jgi:hypothetical protein
MYLIAHDGTVGDYDLDFLARLLETFDAQLAQVIADAEGCIDPDSFGYIDRLEYLAGVGFTACQQYVTATYSTPKLKPKDARTLAFTLGPKHYGRSVVQLVNAGANYWKHRDQGLHADTVESIAAAGVDAAAAYVSYNLLAAIVGDEESPFERLKAYLVQWRGNFIAATRPGT